MSNNIRTPAQVKKMSQISILPTGHRDADSLKVPFRTARNLKHCHYLKGIRDVSRIDRRDWEEKVAQFLRRLEKQRLYSNNSFLGYERDPRNEERKIGQILY